VADRVVERLSKLASPPQGGRWLKQIRQNVTTVGVEIDQSIAAVAASAMDEVLVADLDKGLEALNGYRGRVDLLLLLDVLEHLNDPWTRLKEFKALLSPTGVVIASIPNVRNLKVLLPPLVNGQWQYQGAGILDRTHLRFFTRRTVLELFEGAGDEIQQTAMTGPLRTGQIKSVSGECLSCQYTACRVVEGFSRLPMHYSRNQAKLLKNNRSQQAGYHP
jgi:SAM-dependent methyltransferase